MLSSFQDVLEGFLRTRHTQTTRASYRSALHGFMTWWETTDRHGPLTNRLLRSYRDALLRGVHKHQGDPLKANTVNVYLSALRSLCQWCVDVGQLADNPMEAIERVQVKRTDVRACVTEAEIGTLLRTFDRTIQDPVKRELAYRNFAIAVLWSESRLRSIDLIRAKRLDLKTTDEHPVLVIGNNSPVILRAYALNALYEYWALHDRWHGSDSSAYRNPTDYDHPIFTKGRRGRYSERSTQQGTVIVPCCQPIAVETIQNTMRQHLRKAGLRDVPPDSSGNVRRLTPESLRHVQAPKSNADWFVCRAEHFIPDFSKPCSNQDRKVSE